MALMITKNNARARWEVMSTASPEPKIATVSLRLRQGNISSRKIQTST
jgi:hypothetical protein